MFPFFTGELVLALLLGSLCLFKLPAFYSGIPLRCVKKSLHFLVNLFCVWVLFLNVLKVAGVLTLRKFPDYELPYAILIDAAVRQDPSLVE
jgi:hypothetical protein